MVADKVASFDRAYDDATTSSTRPRTPSSSRYDRRNDHLRYNCFRWFAAPGATGDARDVGRRPPGGRAGPAGALLRRSVAKRGWSPSTTDQRSEAVGLHPVQHVGRRWRGRRCAPAPTAAGWSATWTTRSTVTPRGSRCRDGPRRVAVVVSSTGSPPRLALGVLRQLVGQVVAGHDARRRRPRRRVVVGPVLGGADRQRGVRSRPRRRGSTARSADRRVPVVGHGHGQLVPSRR